MRPLVISGAPGTGKSSVAAIVAEQLAHGVHLETDHFFRFVAHRLDPSKAEAREQNLTIVRAYCAAACEFSAGGNAVVLDGVIGPWLFPTITPVLGEFDYLLLSCAVPIARARIGARTTQPSARISMADRMYPQFLRAVQEYGAHTIDTDTRTPEEVAHIVLERQSSGTCTIRGA